LINPRTLPTLFT